MSDDELDALREVKRKRVLKHDEHGHLEHARPSRTWGWRVLDGLWKSGHLRREIRRGSRIYALTFKGRCALDQ